MAATRSGASATAASALIALVLIVAFSAVAARPQAANRTVTEANRLVLPIRERERFTHHTVDIGAFYGTVNRQEVARAHTSGARSLCRPRRTPVAPLIPLSKDSGPAGD